MDTKCDESRQAQCKRGQVEKGPSAASKMGPEGTKRPRREFMAVWRHHGPPGGNGPALRRPVRQPVSRYLKATTCFAITCGTLTQTVEVSNHKKKISINFIKAENGRHVSKCKQTFAVLNIKK